MQTRILCWAMAMVLTQAACLGGQIGGPLQTEVGVQAVDPNNPAEVTPNPPDPVEDDPLLEVCDGRDNDGDGAVDEDTDGSPCTTWTNEAGAITCVGGVPNCTQCVAGTQQESTCPCGGARIDRCGDDGVWRRGVCDGCPDTPQGPCDRLDACIPGTTEIRRCDVCTGPECGTDCIGSEWRCTLECAWEQITPCQIYEEVQCSQDDVRIEPCGRCGYRNLVCDGCFWVASACEGRGACEPGETKTVPCGDLSCAEGFASEVGCNADCTWQEVALCSGCTPGTHIETTECVPGKNCGERIVQTVCELAAIPICAGDRVLQVGSETKTILQDCLLPCLPGDTRSSACSTALGGRGTQEEVCSDSCEWQVTSGCACPAECDPGSIVQVDRESCGNPCDPTAEEVTTWTCQANGCGTTPTYVTCGGFCSPGSVWDQWCTLPDGRCGTRGVTCDADCDWADDLNDPVPECVARPEACVPGTSQASVTSCGPNYCGRTYTTTRTCDADGCGFSTTRTPCPECQAGQQMQESCVTATGQCGTRVVTCSSTTCEWVTGTCTPRPDACVPNETRTQTCTATCGLPGQQTLTCNFDGCGWHVTGVCTSTEEPVCSPGQGEEERCPGCQTAHRERTCDSTCNWTSWSECPPCG